MCQFIQFDGDMLEKLEVRMSNRIGIGYSVKIVVNYYGLTYSVVRNNFLEYAVKSSSMWQRNVHAYRHMNNVRYLCNDFCRAVGFLDDKIVEVTF